MITVIYHSADFDGIFCREIASHFLGDRDVQYIGWNFGDPEISFPSEGSVYVMDLAPKNVFGNKGPKNLADRTIWIDHHATSISAHGDHIPGYRIDGVAACRLAWQWFSADHTDFTVQCNGLPQKQDFIDRKVSEPLAVCLAGEYDVWDRNWMEKDPRILRFQYGLRTLPENAHDFACMLKPDIANGVVDEILERGEICQEYQQNMDRVWLGEAGHVIQWEGLKFLAKNTVERGNNMFLSKDLPETGHDALLAYGFRGKVWTISLYHAKHRTDIDLSLIAVKHGGGGHRGACGFTCKTLPFNL